MIHIALPKHNGQNAFPTVIRCGFHPITL